MMWKPAVVAGPCTCRSASSRRGGPRLAWLALQLLAIRAACEMLWRNLRRPPKAPAWVALAVGLTFAGSLWTLFLRPEHRLPRARARRVRLPPEARPARDRRGVRRAHRAEAAPPRGVRRSPADGRGQPSWAGSRSPWGAGADRRELRRGRWSPNPDVFHPVPGRSARPRTRGRSAGQVGPARRELLAADAARPGALLGAVRPRAPRRASPMLCTVCGAGGRWDWSAELPAVVCVSMLLTPYGGWIFDLAVLLVPLVRAAVWVVESRRWRLGGRARGRAGGGSPRCRSPAAAALDDYLWLAPRNRRPIPTRRSLQIRH